MKFFRSNNQDNSTNSTDNSTNLVNEQIEFDKQRKQWQEAERFQYDIDREIYDQDGLFTNHYHEFMKDSRFIKAYERGVKAVNIDYKWHWRVHVFLWAFSVAVKLDGDFVECGVYKGFMFSAAMTYVNWNKLEKRAYLFDTYKGIDTSQLTEDEIKLGRVEQYDELYKDVYEDVKANFAEFKDVELIKGSVPKSLERVKIDQVAFVAIDMNNAYPEAEAFKYFWPKLVKGGIILFDDYAYNGYYPQKQALDVIAKEYGIEILSLPTGQGLIIK